MTLVIYHGTDLDGKCSAAIIRLLADDMEIDDCLEFMPMNYGWDFDWDQVKDQQLIYMVDFCLDDFDDMVRLNDLCPLFVWIDHHKTAIQKWEEAGRPMIDGLREVGKAGCELTWDHCQQVVEGPSVPMPPFVHLLGRYDVWDHEDPAVMAFQFGMRMVEETDPEASIWDDLLGDPFNEMLENLIHNGHVVLAYEDGQDKIRSKNARYIDFRGYRAVAMNLPGANSKRFKYCTYKEHDIQIAYFYTNRNFWKVTLYSDTVDVGDLAKKLGGGGHKGAAGFQASTMKMIYLGLLELGLLEDDGYAETRLSGDGQNLATP